MMTCLKHPLINDKRKKLTAIKVAGALALNLLTVISHQAFAHGTDQGPSHKDQQPGPRGIINLDWQANNINRTFTAGYPDSFGVSSFFRRELPKIYAYHNKQCINANFIAFDIDDQFAYNTDENIEIELTFDASKTDSVFYGFDANAKADGGGKIKHSNNINSKFFTTTVNLERARFANRGMDGADLALTAVGTNSFDDQEQLSTFSLCDINIKRSGSVKNTAKTANLSIQWHDNKKPTSVRFGIYDQTGRAVLASDDAVDIPFYEKTRKVLSLQNYQPRSQPWPHKNRYISYANGSYSTQLPAGEYTIVASKGPEYRFITQPITITADRANSISIDMERWDNLPAKGWYSGDVHIHMTRDKQQLNPSIMAILQAEDIHISNLLLMSNAGDAHFDQYAYGKKGQHTKDIHSIISGIEGPRTAQRGHAIALNIEKPIIDEDNYFLYHLFMENYHQQNAINGYAHVGSEEFNASWGLALDMPYGLVDFVEIMQNSELRTEFWYQFLGLGYKLAPASGSDFPYFDQPGAVRSYAKTNTISQPSPQQWFDAMKAGNTFVSNGPIIEFTINGKEMGSSISMSKQPLIIKASATVNPYFDKIKSIELLSCGKVIERIELDNPKQRLNLDIEIPVSNSQWLAVRAYGEKYGIVHSAPIYIENDQGFSGCDDQVEELAKIMISRLDNLSTSPIKVYRELEYWETTGLEKQYKKQLPQLLERIEKTKDLYNQLINR